MIFLYYFASAGIDRSLYEDFALITLVGLEFSTVAGV